MMRTAPHVTIHKERYGVIMAKNQLHIGCHLSLSEGYYKMGLTAQSIGADTFAFFTRNPRGGRAREINEEDLGKLRELLSSEGFAPLVAHAPYTLNAASADEGIRKFGWEMFEGDLHMLEHLPGNYYNFHPGSHVGQGVDVGIAHITSMLNACMFREQKTTVLLECMAGKGSELGRDFEEIRRILDGTVLEDKIGVCLDTCHIFDGGYDIVGHLDAVLEDFDRVIGLSKLCAVHLNDSLNGLGSHKDRHAVIGGGQIGLEALSGVINHSALKGLPFILETPNELPGYAKEIALLRERYIVS